MEELIFEIDPDTMDYLQCLYYETLAYKSIMEDILTKKRDYEHNIKTCDHFMEKYQESFVKFEITKQEVVIEYAGIEYTKDDYVYTFEFLNRKLIIKKQKVCSI